MGRALSVITASDRMVKNKMSKKSFTLIEIIIVIVVVGLLSAWGLAYYNTFNEQKKLEQETSRLADTIHLANTKSVSGDQSPFPTCVTFAGYRVEMLSGSYNLVFCCNACSAVGDRIVIASYTLPSTVQIVNPVNISFFPLTGQISAPSSVTIKNSALTTQCRSIDIQQSGVESTYTVNCP